VGTSPANYELLPTFTMWDYASWSPNRREKDPRRNLQYHVHTEIRPRAARTFGLKLRVSPRTEWKHLLEPYKDWFRAVLGPAQYNPSHRPWIMVCANKSARYISEKNPYGYHDGLNRLDTKEGVHRFCDMIIPLLRETGGQGVVIWGQQGTEPRGAEYRPDFDILPPETRENWPMLRTEFEEAGLRIGVTTRPDVIAVRKTWTHDTLVRRDADSPSQRRVLWQRFKNMIDMGATAFYLDSFGMRLEDVKLMRYLRENMGPDIQTFAEMHCDAMLPYSGFYMHVTYHGETRTDGDAFNIMWLGSKRWEIFRWLVDDRAATAGRVDDGVYGRIEPGLHYEWMLKHRLSPLEQLWRGNFSEGIPILQELLPHFLDENDQWTNP
jgi:hypothetical protein